MWFNEANYKYIQIGDCLYRFIGNETNETSRWSDWGWRSKEFLLKGQKKLTCISVHVVVLWDSKYYNFVHKDIEFIAFRVKKKDQI